jgi:hypothetical protein
MIISKRRFAESMLQVEQANYRARKTGEGGQRTVNTCIHRRYIKEFGDLSIPSIKMEHVKTSRPLLLAQMAHRKSLSSDSILFPVDNYHA